MTSSFSISEISNQISDLVPVRHIGRVIRVDAGVVHVRGLTGLARIGDPVTIYRRSGKLTGEVLRLADDRLVLLPDESPDGVALGDRVALGEASGLSPCDSWIGRIIDPYGRPLDGRALLRGAKPRPLRGGPPEAGLRRALGDRLETGTAVLNTMLPIVRGQRMGLFAGSGVGKSSLLGKLAQSMEADVVVIALIGERGRELRHFVDQVLGPEGLARSVIVTATSDRSPILRRRCAWAAMAVAEHFRDEGHSVLFLADSITRFAEAHREVAVAGGEAPVLRGYPPSTAHQIMQLCERAGPGLGTQGDITGIFSVLVAGSDMEEPIADILRGVLDGHVVLDRAIAERGRFPAVDVLRSVSRSLPDAAAPSENALLMKARRLLSAYDRNSAMIHAGLYVNGSDPEVDDAIQLWNDLDAFLGKVEQQDIAHSFTQLEVILRRARSMGSGGARGSLRPHGEKRA
ncbi:FliI/YscN family ATPase [Sulfitobacter sp. LCG007]